MASDEDLMAGFQRQVNEIRLILWGPDPSDETFKRWSQGFVFSVWEPTALEQKSGGPCAILAPIQAYMLKSILARNETKIPEVNREGQLKLLVGALVEVLLLAKRKNCNKPVTIAYRRKDGDNQDQLNVQLSHEATENEVNDSMATTSKENIADEEIFKLPSSENVPSCERIASNQMEVNPVEISTDSQTNVTNESPARDSDEPKDQKDSDEIASSHKDNVVVENSTSQAQLTVDNEVEMRSTASTPSYSVETMIDPVVNEQISVCPPTKGISHLDLFHQSINYIQFRDEADIESFLAQHIDEFRDEFGLLLFLYSLLLTKGVNVLTNEIGDLSEPLIHRTYGYGSQSLVNLMLTGRAVQHVWDNDQDVEGLTLKGIDEQSNIGFITMMEHMRYITVGSYYKNPKFPIWVLGSDTHLTVLFSFDLRLVNLEQPWDTAKRIFRVFDPEGNDFISPLVLPDLLSALGFFNDDVEYLKIIRRKLDPESLGVILLNNFLTEFYPGAKSNDPQTFSVLHYNGLAGSCPNRKVAYVQGQAVLLDCDMKTGGCESNQINTCLQTKWPTIETEWITPTGRPPSLN